MVAATLKKYLQEVGLPLDTLLKSIAEKTIDTPLEVCKSMDGKISLVTMPDGCYFEGITCWVESVPFLIAKDVAEDWNLLPRPGAHLCAEENGK